MRNGDYTPTRMEAQTDALNLISSVKIESNPESVVGVIACGNRRSILLTTINLFTTFSPNVLVTLGNDLGKILACFHGINLSGNLNFLTGLQVAQVG
jgi:26S proteasome regulatory subunit N10